MIKWKKSNALNPEIVLKKLAALRDDSPDKKSFVVSNELELALSALENMIDFPAIFIEKDHLILEAIRTTESLTKDTIIDKINELIYQQEKIKEKTFHILSSLSLAKGQSKTITVNNVKIEILEKSFPENFLVSRKKLLDRSGFDESSTSEDYSKIMLTVKSKSIGNAFERAFNALDLQRSIWCIFSNSLLELIPHEGTPVNAVRLGEFHTIHSVDGSIAYDSCFYEPNFLKAKPIEFKKDLANNSQEFFDRLKNSAYSNKLEDALLRYVRALDEKDQNNAIIKLWGALESLASPSGSNGDLITRRCAFLFKESEFHKQILEHLREYRNKSVHAGQYNHKAKKYCFQLQYYFVHLIRFHLSTTDHFKTLDQANEFLDFSPNENELLRKKELTELAISYRAG